MRHALAAAVGLALLALATPTLAGPPYVTDDPEPTDTGHWEVYGFGSGTHVAGQTAGETGLDINYGAIKDLQLTLVAPLDFDTTTRPRLGTGDIELGGKYRFIHQAADGWVPDVSLFPQLDLPTDGRHFGAGRATLFLPLWAQKDWGDWSSFGGGGYEINPGAGQRDYWLLGWAVTRKISETLNLGGEIYRQTADTRQDKAVTMAALGFSYQFSPHFALIGSGGPSLQSASGHRQSALYLAIEFTY